MTTGRSTVSTCSAYAALAGNPSERYGGAMVAMPLPDLTAMAALRESEAAGFAVRTTDADLRALVDATVEVYRERVAAVPAVELSLSTNIPPGVGFGRTGALVIATLRSFAAFEVHHTWEPDELATVALDVVRGRLGVDVTVADLLVPAHGRPLSISFGPTAPERIERLELPDGMFPFIAWFADDTAADDTATIETSSNTVQRSLRRRFDGGDPDIVAAMDELRLQASRARRGILSGDVKLLADAMHRTLAVRVRLTELSSTERRLIEIGRSVGAVVNCTGSGRSAVGLARHAEHLELIEAAYTNSGVSILPLG